MRKFLLAGYLILLPFTQLLSHATANYEQYTKLSEQNFNAQHFDSCQYYNYILAHKYKQDKDTIGIVNIWYTIAIVNLLQGQYSYAQAARTLARQYVSCHNIDYDHLDNIYNSILGFKNQKSIRGKGLPSIPFQKLKYIKTLLNCEYEFHNNQSKNNNVTLRNIIFDMREKGDTNWYGYAQANMLIGNYHYKREEILMSAPYYQTAIRIYGTLKTFNSDYINSYRGFLNALWFTGQSEKRDSCFNEIEKVNFMKENRAGYYFMKGDFRQFTSPKEAIEAYLQAYYSKGIDASTINELKKQIIFYYAIIAHYNKAIEWYKALDTKSISCFDKIIFAYCNYKIGNFNKSNITIKKALKSSDFEYNQNVLYWLAKYYFETKQYDKAEVYYQLFLCHVLKTYSNRIQISLSYGSVGYFYWYAKNNYKRSLEYYHKAVFELVNTHAPDNLYQMPDINKSVSDEDLSMELNNKSEALYEISKNKGQRLKNLKACLANLELSLIVGHRYKMSLSNDEQRFEYADHIKQRFPFIINVCISLYQETGELLYAKRAFEYAEKSKASLLLSTIRGINAYKIRLLPEKLKRQEDQLWSKAEILSRYLSEAYKAPELNHVKIDQYNVLLSKLRHQQDSLVQIFKTKYPSYYNVRYNAEVTNADFLQKSLSANEALIEYSVSSEKLVIFVLTRNEFKIISETLGSQFYSNVEKYRQILANYSLDDYSYAAIRTYSSVSNQLYNQLIQPIETFLSGKKLLIISDDVLTQIPFETLVSELPPKNRPVSYRSLPYLIKKHDISYSYSGTLYTMNYLPLTFHNAKLLAVAPYFDKIKLEPLIAKDLPDSLGKLVKVSPIAGIYKEVKGIHRLFGGRILMNGNATKENFKEIVGQYDILHLATHGAINNEYPMYSKLLFTVGKDSTNDGLLNEWEIYNMQSNTTLVVLSACNTGYGKLHKGEGIISMSRGFFTAGAKSVITTLWTIPDGCSSRLMNYFYTNLAAKENISKALYHAKLTYIEQGDDIDAHPSLWAGYLLFGNANIIFEPYHLKTNYFYYAGICLLVTIFITFRKRIRSAWNVIKQFRIQIID